MKRNFLKNTVIGITIALMSTNLISCSALFPVEEAALKPPLVKQSSIKYSTTKVERGDVEISSDGSARSEGTLSVKLSFTDISGRVCFINNTPGSVIKAGDIVAELDNAFIKKSLEQANINLKKAEINYEELKKNGAVAPNIDIDIAQTKLDQQRIALKELEQQIGSSTNEQDKCNLQLARLSYDKAKAEYERLVKLSGQQDSKLRLAQLDVEQQKLEVSKFENELKNTILKSPVNGTIKDSKSFSIGDSVSAGEMVCLIEDSSTIKIVARVNPSDMPDLKDGNEVILKYKDKEYPARAKELKENFNDADKPNFIFVPNDKIPDLQPSESITFRLIKAKHTNVLRLSKNAVVIPLGDNSGTATVSVLEDNVVVEKQVVLDLIGATFVEIKAGLNEGDRVVIR
ncbi:HlyD family efflux transporter periplasmic adaptor subunit [Paludicola sp. MB14-C6]|uniref:efflux RND transporter periplasmic adaptor subunit n=1 Tax=Paludihabitans sp. MB14-C6 TaxID=3070656 RepID=UPI0027DB8055|nr:HlyD family efflux transporter periplasmic adaptor subunit [Paludicola sp. MB14-C6]WMJ23081.1 HlyD family efflux transporter periplasmic adaptor subunit [Paludicola sp. MB14-C6]